MQKPSAVEAEGFDKLSLNLAAAGYFLFFLAAAFFLGAALAAVFFFLPPVNAASQPSANFLFDPNRMMDTV